MKKKAKTETGESKAMSWIESLKRKKRNSNKTGKIQIKSIVNSAVPPLLIS